MRGMIKKTLQCLMTGLLVVLMSVAGVCAPEAAELDESVVRPSISIDLSFLDQLGRSESEKADAIREKDGRETLNGFIYFNQGDAEWNDNDYQISRAGCGPTSMAVVISSLTDRWVTPVDAAAWASRHGYYSPSGSAHAMIPALAEQYGLDCEGVGTNASRIRSALQDGDPVVCLMGPGDFTRNGHFMVLVGIDEADRVTVADVGSRQRSKYKYALEDLIGQSKQASAGGPFWVISNPQADTDAEEDESLEAEVLEEDEAEEKDEAGELTFEVMKDADQKEVEKALAAGTTVMMMTDKGVIDGEAFVYLTMIDSSGKVTVTDRTFDSSVTYQLSELMNHKKTDLTGLSFWKVRGAAAVKNP